MSWPFNGLTNGSTRNLVITTFGELAIGGVSHLVSWPFDKSAICELAILGVGYLMKWPFEELAI